MLYTPDQKFGVSNVKLLFSKNAINYSKLRVLAVIMLQNIKYYIYIFLNNCVLLNVTSFSTLKIIKDVILAPHKDIRII